MNSSGNNPLATGTWGRFVLSTLLLAWLNVAMQPCLMAMELAPDSTFITEHSVHSEHTEHDTNASDCGHCPPGIDSDSVPCESGSASDCEIFPGYKIDKRQFKLQPNDFSPPLALSTASNEFDLSTPVTRVSPHDTSRLKYASEPPLSIRHCVFLK